MFIARLRNLRAHYFAQKRYDVNFLYRLKAAISVQIYRQKGLASLGFSVLKEIVPKCRHFHDLHLLVVDNQPMSFP